MRPLHLRRLGRFHISRELLEDRPDLVLEMLTACIPVRVEQLWHRDAFEYVAICGAFTEVPEGEEPPTYMARIHRELVWVTGADGEPEEQERAAFVGWERV